MTTRWSWASSTGRRRCSAPAQNCPPRCDRTSGQASPAPGRRTSGSLAGDAERSTLDLFHHGWVLLSEDGQWAAAAAHATAETGVPVTFVQVGADVKPVEPAAFRSGYGLESGGATLVRPDGYIAWRAVTAPADPARTLTAALASVSSAPGRAAVGSVAAGRSVAVGEQDGGGDQRQVR